MNLVKYLHFLIIFLILQIPCLFSKSEPDKTGKIQINGNTSDFNKETDQVLLSPELGGRNHESDYDSSWGCYNDISSIKFTWDENNLYIGSDAIINNNNIIIYLDTGKNLGITTVDSLNSWKRRLNFENIKPDFFLASRDNNAFPEFWKIESSSGVFNIEIDTVATFNGTVGGGIEAKIPWHTLYILGERKVLSGAVLKITGVITGGDDSSSPDSAPDTTEDLPQSSEYVTIDNCIIIPIDSDCNGYPDMDVNIRDVSTIAVNTTSLKYQQLQIRDLKVDPRVFTPNNDGINDVLNISYILTKDAKVSVRIFNIEGDLIFTYQKDINLTAGHQVIQWYGYKNDNILAVPGLYLIHIKAHASGISVVKKTGCYLVN